VDTTDGDALIDNVSLKEASYHTPWVHCPTGSGSVTYNSRQYELHNPLSDYCEQEDGYCYASGFCASAWVYTDWAGDDGVNHYLFVSPATAGNNNLWQVFKSNGDSIRFRLYDGAGAARIYELAVTNTNWTSGNWKYVEICSNNSDNVLSAHHYNVFNSTWYDWSVASGAGTGIQNGQSADLHIGNAANTNYCDCYQPEIHISPYSAIYPNRGFNGGKPPENHDPY
jgi:hypothetical protein